MKKTKMFYRAISGVISLAACFILFSCSNLFRADSGSVKIIFDGDFVQSLNAARDAETDTDSSGDVYYSYSITAEGSDYSQTQEGTLTVSSDTGEVSNTDDIVEFSDIQLNTEITLSMKIYDSEGAILAAGTATVTVIRKATPATIELSDIIFYTVTFDANGGSDAPDAVTVESGNTVTEPATDPVLDGYTFDGWYTDAEGTTAWDFSTDTVTDDITLYAKWSLAGTADEYITAGLTALKNESYDEALTDFNKAYTVDPDSNRTKAYSALANLAMISVSSEMTDLMKNRFGITSYPSTVDALLDPASWFTSEYEETSTGSGAYFTEDSSGSYVRVNGTLISSDDYENQNYDASCPVASSYYTYYGSEDEVLAAQTSTASGTYFPWGTYSSAEDSYGDAEYLEITEVSNSGEYAVYHTYVADLLENSADVQYYDFNWVSGDVLTGIKYLFPDMETPDWFADSGLYESSLVNNVETIETLSLRIITNLINCNSSGLNDLIDDTIDTLFGTYFTTAEDLIDSMDTTAVTLTEDELETFGLENVFGDSEASVSKYEFKVLFSALQLFEGTLQYLQSYNLDTDLGFLECDWDTLTADSFTMQSSYDPWANGFLSARSNGSDIMADCKTTIENAVSDLIDSYDYLTGEESPYTQAVKDEITQYGSSWRSSADSFITALENGETFDLSELTGTDYTVDLGTLFTPGYFALDEIISSSSDGSKPVFYLLEDDGSFTELDDSNLADAEDGAVGIRVDGYQLVGFISPSLLTDDDRYTMIEMSYKLVKKLYTYYYGS